VSYTAHTSCPFKILSPVATRWFKFPFAFLLSLSPCPLSFSYTYDTNHQAHATVNMARLWQDHGNLAIICAHAWTLKYKNIDASAQSQASEQG
jgi:hypothetical protein